MSGKPAARITDPTACPVPGHGTNPLVDGSPDVFYDGLSAARLGDKSACGSPITQAVASSVLINGKPAATLGSVGAHGNNVISGSGTVIIGDVAIGGASPVRTLTTDDKGMGSGSNHKAEPNASRADGLGKETNHVASAQSSPQSLVNGNDSSNEQGLGEEQEPPVVNMAEDRWESIINDTPAIFEIAEDPNAKAGKIPREIDRLNDVSGNESIYREVASEVGIDANLVMAIAYMETARGWYDYPYDLANSIDDFVLGGAGFDDWAFRGIGFVQKTFRPMNVNPDYWAPLLEELEYMKEDVISDPRANIRVGAELLKRIRDRVPNPTVEKVASIYVTLGRENTNDYGARVQRLYDTRPWER